MSKAEPRRPDSAAARAPRGRVGTVLLVSTTSHGVMETSIDSAYWLQHHVGARRVAWDAPSQGV